VITWAASDGREEGGDRVVPAASTIKIFVASAFWRAAARAGGLDPTGRVAVPAAAWSVADRLAGPLTLADCALLMLAFSDNAATNVLLDRLGFDAVNAEAKRLGAERTQVRRLLMSDGPENLTCARDLAVGLAAVDEEQVFEALALAQDSELHFRLRGREVLVKTGELWPAAYHEVALVDRKLAVAVCSAPAVLPHEVAARAERVIGDSLERVDSL
jgi:D-alanyl-D-alanine carboxypeptidase